MVRDRGENAGDAERVFASGLKAGLIEKSVGTGGPSRGSGWIPPPARGENKDGLPGSDPAVIASDKVCLSGGGIPNFVPLQRFHQAVSDTNHQATNPAPDGEKRKRFQLGSGRPPSHQGPGWAVIHALGSLKLAMLLFLVIAVASVWGTIEESRYTSQVDMTFGARLAQHRIYHAWWFTFWLIVLCVNLACVTFTRLPWKKRHTGFIVTHYGIITLLIGSMIGKHAGIEGSMNLRIGDPPENSLVLGEMVLHFLDDRGRIYRAPFPMDVSPPRENRPKILPLPHKQRRTAGAPFSRVGSRWFGRSPGEPSLVFNRYSEKLEREEDFAPAPGSHSTGVRLHMVSAMMGGQGMDVTLITEPADKSYHALAGLAQISLSDRIVRDFDAMETPSPLLQIRVTGPGEVEYHVINSRAEVREGELRVGESLETGWADWVVRLEEALPEAAWVDEIRENPALPTGGGLAGAYGWLDWGDGRRTEPQWFLLGDMQRVQLDENEVRFGFGFRRERLPFQVELIGFEVPRDEGTDNPANFTSYLRFTDPETGESVEGSCGMNVPALYPNAFHRLLTGFTYKFSQASWDPDDLEVSTVQVLRDPGWLFKWVGSLTVVAGVYMIFFMRSFRHRRPEDIIDDLRAGDNESDKTGKP